MALKETVPVLKELIFSSVLEDWLRQHADSTDPTDIALIKYKEAGLRYTVCAPRNIHSVCGELWVIWLKKFLPIWE